MDDFSRKVIEATYEYRKGEEVVDELSHGVQVRHIYAMPHVDDAPDDEIQIDMHFIIVGIKPKEAAAAKDALLTWCRSYPEPDRLAGGPSYIELGGILGSQDLALRVMALGKHLGLWDVITPATFHIDGPQADQMAGMGYVMISGWRDG